MKGRSMRRTALLALSLTLLMTAAWIAATIDITRADPPATAAFQRTWERTDKPVADFGITRTWMWGLEAFTGQLDEDYKEAPGGMRLVQYFDKSRMEDNSWRTSTPPWDVTNGLLVVEMMTGQLQVGDAEFQTRQPAQVNVGGDADDPTGPTYATMALVRDALPLPDNELIAWTIDRDGNIVQPVPNLADLGITVAHHVQVPGIDHQIASPFWDFMNSSGLVWQDGAIIPDQLFLNSFYATGYPVTEAYWANIKVAGTYKWVLLQCFERRCLTFTPDNTSGWQVEAGNVGQHYYAWRYGQQPTQPTPTTTASPTATQPGAPTATTGSSPTATVTSSPTATATMTVTATATQPAPPAPNFQFSTTFGEPWDIGTLMNSPQGIAIGGGDIYVADTGNHRIQKYGYDGVFHLQWGSQGNGNGQFNDPVGVAVDSIGAVYVADRGNSRVQIFDSAGNWQQTVTTVDPGGAILHTLQSPEDIAIGGGYVWVIDSGRQQLLGFPTLTNSGNGVLSAINLTTPTGIAFDASTNMVWVTDTGPGFTNLKGYDVQGNLITTTTVPGTSLLEDVAIDSSNGLWVVDAPSNTFYKWHPTGGWKPEFSSSGTGPGQFAAPGSMAGGFGGELVVADTGNNRVQRVSFIGFPVDQWSDNRRGRYLFPSGIDWVGTGGSHDGIYVVDTGLSRIQVVDEQGKFLNDWGAGTTVPPGDPELLLPLDITIDAFGNRFVADTFSNRIVKYGINGLFVQQWGTAGNGQGQFNVPLSVATDSSGNVYVADGANHRIQKFDTTGSYITEWGTFGSAPSQFNTPSGVAVTGNVIYVVDQGNNRVQQFDLSGNPTGVIWGSGGTGPGQFNVPADLAIGPNGNVYVADSQNHRVQAFTPDGQFLRAWGSGPGNGLNQFNVPIDITFDLKTGGTMYVTDRDNHRIQVLTVP